MSRELILFGYMMCAVLAIALVVFSMRRPHVVMQLGQLLERIMKTRATRFGLLVFWWWFGLHYLGG